MEEVEQKLAELLNTLTKENFQRCFDQWKKRTGVVREVEYTERERLVVE